MYYQLHTNDMVANTTVKISTNANIQQPANMADKITLKLCYYYFDVPKHDLFKYVHFYTKT